jgi:N-methylhydantoinase A
MSIEDAAQATITLASENIVGAIREITISQGIDPREVTIVAGGGASGLNIVPIARELGCRRVLLPSTAGALSACGALYSDIISEFTASRYVETHRLDYDAVNETLAGVEAQARVFLDSLAGVETTGDRIEFFVDARYRGQVWELTVPLASSRLGDRADVSALEEAFHDAHERVFAVREPGQYLECLTWKARATATLAKPGVSARASAEAETVEPAEVGPAHFRGAGALDVPRFEGGALPVGTELRGPAIIREPTTTVVLYPDSSAVVTEAGNYLIHIEEAKR